MMNVSKIRIVKIRAGTQPLHCGGGSADAGGGDEEVPYEVI